MSKTATGTLEPEAWEETAFSEVGDGRRLTGANGRDRYRGDIEGEGIWRAINLTSADGSGTFVSIQRLVCCLGDRFGSFLLQLDGTFGQGGSMARWSVVPDSGTGGLQGIRGDGNFVYSPEENSYTLHYDLD